MPPVIPALQALLDEPVGICQKTFPPRLASVPLGEIGDQGLNLLRGDLLLPALVLQEGALEHNVAAMAAWCRDHDVSLAPHGKTTMAPQLLHRQLDAGAWGITAANVSQAAIMREYGVRRVLIANEVVDPAGLRWIADVLNADSTFELLCLADSAAGVALLDEALSVAQARRSLPVLVELGSTRRRAGLRTAAEALEVGAAVAATGRLHLAGVECFEGVIGPGIGPAVTAEVDALLAQVRGVAGQLDEAGCFAGTDEILLSAGGSVFFDRAAELRDGSALSKPVCVVLRSGCYITHDSGAYDELSPLGGARAASRDQQLLPALELWSVVLSRPEPELAILGFGKRDAPYDSYLPNPLRVASRGGDPLPLPEAEVVAVQDHHALLRIPADARLDVGDHVASGISHPCTAFDKWTLVPIVDEHLDVIGAVRTFF